MYLYDFKTRLITALMRTFITAVVAFLLTSATFCHAAVNSQIGFENGIPESVKLKGRATLEHSTEKFKDGSKSAKFSWLGQAELSFNCSTEIEASMKAYRGGVIFWIYNTTPSEHPIRIAFWGSDGKEVCHFDFGMQFRGWRTAWVRYMDMECQSGSYGDLPKEEQKTAVRMTMRPSPMAPQGTVYIDRISFQATRMNDQIAPDMQLPNNNHHLNSILWQWARLWEWEQNPQLEVKPLNAQQQETLNQVIRRVDEWAAKGNPGAEYTKGTLMKRADELYVKYGLGRNADGSVKGAPLLGDDEFNNSLGEMRIQFIQNLVYWYALDYMYTGNKSNVERVITAMDHAIDQGWAYGSSLGLNRHFGYQVRNLYKGLWIMRKEIEAAGRLEEYSRVLAWWSGIAECRVPFQYGRDELLDLWNTLQNCRVLSALMMPDDNAKYANLAAVSEWISGSMSYSPGTLGGFKIDGTSFHHGGHYPAYSVGAFAVLGDFCGFTKGTELEPTVEARKTFKHILMSMSNYCQTRDWGIGISGRHPLKGAIPQVDVEAYGRLAVLGDLTGKGGAVDPELGAAYLHLGGNDKEMISEIKKAGISAHAPKDGFTVYNYAALGIHRRDGWMLSLKSYNTDVWGSEIYARENRFGRYLSYGTAQLIGEESAEESGYVQDGWDWNRIPGATSIHLPFDKLESPLPGTLMEKNDNPFPGASSLEGMNGVLAFTYVEKDRVNFCAGATATKSVFCFDNRIVFIGTGISNSSSYPTETTIFQNRLEDRTEEIDVNDEYFSDFPLTYSHSQTGPAVLADTKKNYYFFKDGSGLTVLKQQQGSPTDTKKENKSGDFATAFINHGVSPKNASYEYMMLIHGSSKDISRFTKKTPYTVLKADNSAHIVNDWITGITAYVCYEETDCSGIYSSMPKQKDSKPHIEAVRIDRHTIVMERSLGEGRVVMSICTPDLGITQKGYTTIQESQPLVRTATIDGVWNLESANDHVQISHENGRTVISAICRHGQPVEFIITK